MMMTTSRPHRVELTEGAKKDLKKLRQHRDRIEDALGRLEDNPLAGHLLRGTLNPLRSVEFNVRDPAGVISNAWLAALNPLRSVEFNVRGSGAFRAIYAVLDNNAICLIVIVGPHENIYDKAERRVAALRAAGNL